MSTLKLRKVLVNKAYGGFRIGDDFIEACQAKAQEKGVTLPEFDAYYASIEARSHPIVIEVFEEFGTYNTLQVDEILESDLPYLEIEEYDGYETTYVNVGNIYKDILYNFLADHKDKPTADLAQLREQVKQKEEEHKAYFAYRNPLTYKA